MKYVLMHLQITSKVCHSIGCSCYVDFTYLDTTAYVEVIVYSQNVFSIFLCISTPSMSKTVNMKQRVSQADFHALVVFSIIFATVYVCFGYVHV